MAAFDIALFESDGGSGEGRTSGMFLITGATGNIGRALADILLGRGHEVRALVRGVERAGQLPAGVDLAVGALDDEASVRRAVQGVAGVFHMQSSHGTEKTAIMIRAAHEAGVRRLVALSSIGAVLEPMPTIGTWFRAREDLLRASGLDVTYLRPNMLMTNALSWRKSIKDTFTVVDPCGQGRISAVDTDDVAAVAAVALTEDGHEGHGYVLTGPQALTTREQVETLSAVLGVEITFIDVTPSEFTAWSIAEGSTREAARAMEGLNELFRAGRAGVLTNDVQNLIGRRPGTFRAWCERNVEAFM